MNIYQKLVEVRKVVKFLKKEAKGKQYSYNSSSQVLQSVRDKMDEVGLLLVPAITDKRVSTSEIEQLNEQGHVWKRTITYFTELDMTMTWVNIDDPKETIIVPWYAQGVDIAGEKGVGKALTYAEKYFMLKQFNIATDNDDPDAQQSEGKSNLNKSLNETTSKHTDNGYVPQRKLTKKQVDRLFAIALSNGIEAADVKKAIMKDYKKTHAEDLTKQEYDALCKRLENPKSA